MVRLIGGEEMQSFLGNQLEITLRLTISQPADPVWIVTVGHASIEDHPRDILNVRYLHAKDRSAIVVYNDYSVHTPSV
jgi:hypothetical protein